MTYRYTDKILAEMMHKAENSGVVAQLNDYAVVTSDLVRVVIATNDLEGVNKHSLRKAIAKTLNYSCTPVLASFRKVSMSNGLPAVVGFVRPQRIVRDYNENAGQYRTLASNMLMDTTDDTLWQVTSDANGNKMLVRSERDNLNSLLVTASTFNNLTPRLEAIASIANVGDYVAFVNPQSQTVNYGYVLANTLFNTGLKVGSKQVAGVQILVDKVTSSENVDSDEADGTGTNPIEDRLDDVITVPESAIVESAY